MTLEHPLQQVSGLISEQLSWPQEFGFKIQSEGDIDFKVVDAENIYDAPAFFNPVMVLNRDLALLFVKLYSMKMDVKVRVFEPLAGIGIRAFRLAKSIPEQIDEIVISDYNDITTAVANVNKFDLNTEKTVFQFKREAKALALELAEKRLQYHFVDLDPFGSPAPFIDSMWPLLSYRAMIAVTATDMTALCGVYPDACLRKYGGYPINNHHCHETATRLLIALVVRSAAKFEKGVRPVFSTNVDHYTKVFFVVRTSRGEANDAMSQIGFSYTCSNCQQLYYTKIDDNKPKCCSEMIQAGPLWIGNLFDQEWADSAAELLPSLDLPSTKRITKLVEEAKSTRGLKGFYQMSTFCKSMKVSQPSFSDLFEAIQAKGYKVVRSTFTDQAIRSDIPGIELQNIVKQLTGEKA